MTTPNFRLRSSLYLLLVAALQAVLLLTLFTTTYAMFDSDGDGISDDQDYCPEEADMGYGIGEDGCPYWDSCSNYQDDDGDGLSDYEDPSCSFGSDESEPVPDSDGDGISDDQDYCPEEADMGYGIDEDGCELYDLSTDTAPPAPNSTYAEEEVETEDSTDPEDIPDPPIDEENACEPPEAEDQVISVGIGINEIWTWKRRYISYADNFKQKTVKLTNKACPPWSPDCEPYSGQVVIGGNTVDVTITKLKMVEFTDVYHWDYDLCEYDLEESSKLEEDLYKVVNDDDTWEHFSHKRQFASKKKLRPLSVFGFEKVNESPFVTNAPRAAGLIWQSIPIWLTKKGYEEFTDPDCLDLNGNPRRFGDIYDGTGGVTSYESFPPCAP